MKLLYLSRIGNNYYGEEGQSGHRLFCLTRIETRLKAFIIDKNVLEARLNTARGPAIAPPPLGVESAFQRAKRLQQEAIARQTFASSDPKARLAQVGSLTGQIAAKDAEIQRLRLWLERQDATVLPDGSINWVLSNRTVAYDKGLAAQQLTRLYLNGGRMYTDAACANPFDTTNLVTAFSGPGKAIYVVSMEGNMHVSRHSVGQRHHSSLLDGKETAAAGELEVRNGGLTWISNKSGHYTPKIVHFLQVLHMLEKHNISNNFRITFAPAPNTEFHFDNTALFQAWLIAQNEGDWDYELNKLQLYTKHLTDAVLNSHAPNPWRWRTTYPTFEEAGVYDIATNVMIPHKDVRQWLKSQNLPMKQAIQSGVGR